MTVLTTLHEDTLSETGKRHHLTHETIRKPTAMVDYTYNMRIVDKSDMQIACVDCLRKTLKRYMRLFYRLVDITILNSYNIYLCKTCKHPSLAEFKVELVRQLVEKYARERPPPEQEDDLLCLILYA